MTRFTHLHSSKSTTYTQRASDGSESSGGHPHYPMHRWWESALDGPGPDQTHMCTHCLLHTAEPLGLNSVVNDFPTHCTRAHVEAVNDKWLFELGNVLMSLLIAHSSLQRPQCMRQRSHSDGQWFQLLETSSLLTLGDFSQHNIYTLVQQLLTRTTV